MAGIFIYKIKLQNYSFISSDDRIYEFMKKELSSHGSQILWEKINVSFEKIKNARKTKDALVARMNIGEKAGFKELGEFFR